MVELIDPLLDPHGETDEATGPPGIRLLAAWDQGRKLSMPDLESSECLGLLGELATVVPEEVMPRGAFLDYFETKIEAAASRDEVREGFVISDLDGTLHKYKSLTWSIWEKKRIVSTRNVLKVLCQKESLRAISGSTCLEACEKCALRGGFSHLTEDEAEWLVKRGQSSIVESERLKLRAVIAEIVKSAKAHWAANVAPNAAQLITEAVEARGGEQVVTVRDVGKAFGKARTVHLFKPILAPGNDGMPLEEFVSRVKTCEDLGALLAAQAASARA